MLIDIGINVRQRWLETTMRNTMKKTAILLTLLLLTTISGRVIACSCVGESSVQGEVEHADAVLVGTMLNKQLVTLTDSAMMKMFPNDTTLRNSPMKAIRIARYDFLVQDIYKGEITNDTLTIYTGLGGGDCGIRFKIGEKYIVYAEDESYFGQLNNDFNSPKATNTFWTNSCTRTTSYYQDEVTEIENFAKKQPLPN